MKWAAAILAGFAPFVPASPAVACMVCYSRTAQDVRAAVFGADFWTNAGAVLAPMPVLVAGVLLIRRFSA